MSSGCTTPDMAVMSQAVPEEAEYSRMNRFTAVLAGGVCIAAVIGGSGEAVAGENEQPKPTTVSSFATKSIFPNFTQRPACEYPGASDASDTPDKTPENELAAKYCLKYGLVNARVALIDASPKTTTKMMKKIERGLESEVPMLTEGVMTFDVMRPNLNAAAKQVIKELPKSSCVNPDKPETMIANRLVAAMPSLGKFAQVIAVADKQPCEKGIFGLSDTRSSADVYRTSFSSLRTKGNKILTKMMIRAAAHEAGGHGLGKIEHANKVNNLPEGVWAYAPIESKHYKNGIFNLPEFLKAATRQEYEPGSNLMGSANEFEPNQTLDDVQKARLDWARRLLNIKGAKRVPVIDESHPFSYTSGTNKPRTVQLMLGANISVGNDPNDVNKVYNALALSSKFVAGPNGKQIPVGVSVTLNNTYNAMLGIVGTLTPEPDRDITTVRMTLPDAPEFSGGKREAVIKMARDGSFSVKIESVAIAK